MYFQLISLFIFFFFFILPLFYSMPIYICVRRVTRVLRTMYCLNDVATLIWIRIAFHMTKIKTYMKILLRHENKSASMEDVFHLSFIVKCWQKAHSRRMLMSESWIIISADTSYQILMAILYRVIKVTMSYAVLIMMSKWIGFSAYWWWY